MADAALDRGRSIFMEEASELLEQLEDSLLELEDDPGNQELIGAVFRALHTIKGSGAMFGFEKVSGFTHEVETVFDMVRNGALPVTPELIDITLQAKDVIRQLLEAELAGQSVEDPLEEQVLAGLRGLVPPLDGAEEVVAEERGGETATEEGSDEVGPVTYRIRFRPARNLFVTGTNPIGLLDELRELGECEIVALTDTIPRLSEMDPEACYVGWDIVITTDKGENALKDVFIFVEDESDITIEEIADYADEDECEPKRLGEILVEKGDLAPQVVEEVLGEQKKIGELLVEKGVVSPVKVQAALAEQDHIRRMKQKLRKDDTASIRVASPKLDTLLNLVGELVTVQARLSRLASDRKDPQLISIAEEVERLTGDLRENAMSIRMLPIGTTFNKLRRLVRDLARELGKEVVLETEGAETELDKTVIEKLNDPLVHLIRNSVDHGIEPPDQREAAGKPRQGTIRLSALYSGANVIIKISDDGAGIDPDVVKAKAVEKGIIQPDISLSEKEIYGLLFAPGFSTAKEVTSVSGRGVGMDVVKTNIEGMRGSIEIESERGKGTTVILRLPMTLAIIEGLLANIGEENYILPLSAVEECLELDSRELQGGNGRRLLNVRGQAVPYLFLREVFDVKGTPPPIQQVIITEVDGMKLGVVVDEVVGSHQTVIKSLGHACRNIKEISGATILGDGTVALIVDLSGLAAECVSQN